MKGEDYFERKMESINLMKCDVEETQNRLNKSILALVESQEEYALALKEKYPIASFIGYNTWCHGNLADDYDFENYMPFVLTEERVSFFNRFTVHDVFTGEALNDKFLTEIFEEGKFVMYVRYEYEDEDEKYGTFIFQMKQTPFEQRLIKEYLIFKVN